jgi:hypothetical protein
VLAVPALLLCAVVLLAAAAAGQVLPLPLSMPLLLRQLWVC